MINSWHSTCIMYLQITAMGPLFIFFHFAFYHSRFKPYELDQGSPLPSYFQLGFILRDHRMKSREQEESTIGILWPWVLFSKITMCCLQHFTEEHSFHRAILFPDVFFMVVVTAASLKLRNWQPLSHLSLGFGSGHHLSVLGSSPTSNSMFCL